MCCPENLSEFNTGLDVTAVPIETRTYRMPCRLTRTLHNVEASFENVGTI